MQACLFGKLLILYQQINFNINLNPNLQKTISEIGTLFNDHGTFFEQLSPDL
jgi:hypothetical protein